MTDKMHQEFKKRRAKLAGQLIQGEDWPSAYRMADELLSWTSFEAGWLASRETLVVKLPQEQCLEPGIFAFDATDVRIALHVAGIKTAS